MGSWELLGSVWSSSGFASGGGESAVDMGENRATAKERRKKEGRNGGENRAKKVE